MSDTSATIVETPVKTGEQAVERPAKSAETAIESGDVSGVYRIAQGEVDQTVTRELGISKVEEPGVAAIAGPQIIALKQADAEFQQKTGSALGKLKSAMDVTRENDARLEAVAEKAMQEGPLNEEEMAADLEKHEAEEAKKLEVVKETPMESDEPEITIGELTPQEQEEVKLDDSMAQLDEDIARGVGEFEAGVQKIDTELNAEKKALEEFSAAHGTAHTKLEQAYLDALQSRISALEFDKKAHETSDKSFETMSKQVAMKQEADKAEAAYQAMYDGFMQQPVDVEKKPALKLNEEDEDFEAKQYEAFHPGAVFGSEAPEASRPTMTATPESPMGAAPAKKKSNSFIESLKFWKYMTGEKK